MVRTVDTVIIGAGVVGTSIAYHLAASGAGRTLILDKVAVGAGASGASSALVRMHYSFPPEVRLAVKSLEYFENWKEMFGVPSVFHRTGFIRIVPNHEIDLLRANVEMQRACGADAELMTGDDIRELLPDWNLEGVDEVAYEASSGYGDGATVANDFLQQARDRGVLYEPGTEVLELRVSNGRVHSVVTDVGEIEVGRLVVAAGAWSERLLRTIGVGLPLEPEYHEVAILERPPELVGSHPACIDTCLLLYFRSEGTTQTLVGGWTGPRDIGPDDYGHTPGLDGLSEQVAALAQRVPGVVDAGIVGGVSGIYTMTPDARALMGSIPDVDELYVCTGFSGMGFKISPAVGLVMSELILHGQSSTVDISDFRPTRFTEGCPIRAEFEYDCK